MIEDIDEDALWDPIMVAWVKRPASPRADLSPRLRETVRLFAQGRSYDRVAAEMGITYHTVSNNIRRARDHYSVRTYRELLMALGWLVVPSK